MDKIIDIKGLSKSFGDKKASRTSIYMSVAVNSSPSSGPRAAARPPSCG